MEGNPAPAGLKFETGTTSIGRGDDNDIVIPDKAISRRHAEIYFDGDRFFIRGLGSDEKTQVVDSD